MENSERLKYFSDSKIIGIDPGVNGAISIYSVDKKMLIEVVKMPETPTDLLTFLKLYAKNSEAYLEKVGGIPGSGGASAMFNFGKGYGHLEMALIACKIPFVTVTPQMWMKFFQLGTKGKMTGTQWKNKLKAKSQQLFPNVKVTLINADALLIMRYGFYNSKLSN